MLRRVVLTAVLIVGMGVAASPADALTAPPPVPRTMAAVGDSITRAFDVSGSYFLRDAPAESWSTGTDTAVSSEYQRLLAAHPGSTIAHPNDAVTGAKMSALPGQMSTAAGQAADYVTVLMGANDVCTKTVIDMTKTTAFAASFDQAMATITAARPQVVVFVSSIPNVYQLWSVLHTSSSARLAWSVYGVCQDMLGSSVTEGQRQTVLSQLQADNAALAGLCTGKYAANCVWDGGATYNVAFSAKQVSTVDYFHPNVAGQALLAQTAWTAGPYGH
jgi:lysophospholipase L1-like esterase